MKEENPNSSLQILAVVTHPHDFTHMAGTCGLHVQRGDKVTVVSITGGGRTHNEILDRELKKPRKQQDFSIVDEPLEKYAQRKQEQLSKACALFGITDVRVLPFADQPLDSSLELEQAVADIILELRPQLLLTESPYPRRIKGDIDMGTDDHVTAGVAVSRAVQRAAIPDPATRSAPHRIAKIYYGQGQRMYFRDYDVVVDITDQAANRLKAEAFFTTQGHSEEYAMKRIEVEVANIGWKTHACAYAEAFIQADPSLVDHLPVTELELKRAVRPTTESQAIMSYRVWRDQPEP